MDDKVVYWESQECPWCGALIPYRISRTYFYCFECQRYSLKGEKKEDKERCDWIPVLETGVGSVRKCSIHGTVKMFPSSDSDRSEAVKNRKNLVNSVDWAVESEKRWCATARTGPAVEPRKKVQLSDEARAKAYASFERMLERRSRKRSERQAYKAQLHSRPTEDSKT